MHRLAGSDAGFLFIETPEQTSVCVDLAELEPIDADAAPLTLDGLRRHIAARLPLLPSWRWRVEQVPLGLHHPVWVEDPDFDLDYHVRQRTLPAPGGAQELDDVMAEIEPQLLDVRHPLWQVVLVHGLDGGRQALILRFHHTIGDGAALLHTLGHLFGPAPSEPDAWQPEAPKRRTLLRDAAREQARNWREVPSLVRTSRTRFGAVEERRKDADAPVPRSMADAPGTVLNRRSAPVRTYGRTILETDALQQVRHRTGVTLNDVLLAVVSGALRAELEARGELPEGSLVVNVPVAGAPTGEPQRQWGNGFSNFLAVLATDVADPVERLAAIAASTAEAKVQLDLQGRDTLPRWLDRIPPAIAKPASRFMIDRTLKRAETANFNVLVSNVRANDDDWTISGHRLSALYMSGPIAEDAGLNITVVGFHGRLHTSIVASPTAIPDPSTLIERLHASMEELVACTA